ncbi:glycerophosphoryl diester phosphodiesterase [Terrihabitans soli]|uniref:Glycerophosphoryl diester phosphodiesterase n=1 Tax=Terrihabitans soli TaxID=708113 RepID=A0A6S6QU94_9HYPH|nr:glycerophosphodiester phosphodiesterase family protein [Terrihabitans soli]BCJ91135.1 glycerophosphoryl diester phosphodiesterase [Terrihabitans soli]
MNLDLLFERPIAHRGLHEANAGIIENSRTAVLRAVEAGYGFEVDVQMSADGEAMVFHDEKLDRLTGETGPVKARTAAELKEIALKDSAFGDRIWTLGELLLEVRGRAAAIIEIKTLWDHDMRLAERTARLLSVYPYPAAAKSFDPEIVAAFGKAAPEVPRGIIGYAYPADGEEGLTALKRFYLRHLLHWPKTRPHFISWAVRDLEMVSVRLAHRITGAPVMTWTVRTEFDQARAGLHADQMIFEGFLP